MTNLVTLKNPVSPAAEAFRVLRTNILFAAVDTPIRTLLVTSPSVDEDKSLAVANLAVTMAQGGHKTILVDADLRRPSLHTIWNIPNDQGLTSMVLDNSLQPPLKEVGVENLFVLPSGPIPPNPADLMGGKRMENVIDCLRDQAEYVLFDAPPVLAATDAMLLGAKLDALLMVIKAGVTRRDNAVRAVEMLNRIKIRIIGVALTNAPRDMSVSTYYNKA